jgi:hypothetical protein
MHAAQHAANADVMLLLSLRVLLLGSRLLLVGLDASGRSG